MLDNAEDRKDTRFRCATLVGAIGHDKGNYSVDRKRSISVQNQHASRRKFLKVAATTIAVPYLIPANILASPAANSRIRVGLSGRRSSPRSIEGKSPGSELRGLGRS